MSPAVSRSPVWKWTVISLVTGVLALLWLLLRSATKPSRLGYPCQQAALSTAMVSLGAPITVAGAAVRRWLAGGAMWWRTRFAAVLIVAVTALGAVGFRSMVAADGGPRLLPPRDYRAELFHVAGCPEDPAGDHFEGVDRLFDEMGRRGLKIHRSAQTTPLAGADGIIAADDVVLVKINYQWPERGGTNVDVLRGLIRVILDHPDGFSGEVVVCENTQFAGSDGFDRALNNGQDPALSPRDVVDHFAVLGGDVSIVDWTPIRFTGVGEYSTGDMADGYLVGDVDPPSGGRTSYPKFQTDHGTYVSMRDGIWDPGQSSYDRDRLKVINVPVLKSHHAVYGATAAVKHYMGVVTCELGTNSHNALRYGLLGSVMAEIRPPDLNILDAIWINADPHDGPWCSYGTATRRNELVASTDPVALDIWSVTNILIPAFLDNGFLPPWPYPDATPDDPDSVFRTYLDSSMSRLLVAGFDVTNDLDAIDVHAVDMLVSVFDDGFEGGDTSRWSQAVP